jgi:hypothetical protein
MQPLTDPPRDGLSAAQVVDLLQNQPAIVVAGGLEIVDIGLTVIEDISDDLAGGNVERNSYNTLHGSARLRITRVIDWGGDLLRPYVVISGGGVSARWNLGVYHPSTPTWPLDQSPPTFEVEGYDILLRLAQPVGSSYSILAGETYLGKVEQLLQQRGYGQYLIDPDRAATVSPTSRVWAFDPQTTWLTVVNDLLASVGYAGIWSDWDGRLRCEPYQTPLDRSPEWYYTDAAAITMLSTKRSVDHDFFAAPNRWIAYRSNLVEGETPVEGNGIYTFTNDGVGETSVQARRGLVITRPPEGFDVADQQALIAQAQSMIDADMHVPSVYHVETAPNPQHWHFDRMMVFDSAAFPAADVMCTQWSLPLPADTGDMSQEWRVLGDASPASTALVLPAVAASDPVVVVTPTVPPAGTPKTAALVTDLHTINGALFPTATNVTAAGWRARLSLPAPGGTAILSTGANRYDLTSSRLWINVARLPSFATASCYLMVRVSTSPDSKIFIGMEAGNLLMREVVAGTVSDATIAFNRYAHRWWGLRHDGTNIIWEVSDTGLTWSSGAGITRAPKVTTLNLTSVEIAVEGLWTSTAGAANRFEVSHLNVAPVTTL